MNGVVPNRWSQLKSTLLPGLVFLAVGIYAVPQFLRMPLTNDAQMYDLQVRLLNTGGQLYQDILEPNLPGVVWLQSLARWAGGWSSETLRMFDLLMFAGVLALIFRWFAVSGWSTGSRIWLVTAVLWFYVSQSEWCHCQRDGWLLLPVFAALSLRRAVIQRQQLGTATSAALFGMTLLEGLCWGSGVWLKPHVILPAILACALGWFVSRPGKRVLPELGGLLLGGLMMGALGTGWMIQHECWAPFWDVAKNWNPQYFAAGREHWTLSRFAAVCWRLSPWMLLHIPAIFIALQSIRQAVSNRNGDPSQLSQALLATVYLGWAAQAFFLQHLFDYIHAPVVLLALLIVATPVYRAFAEPWCRVLVAGFAGLAIVASPLCNLDRVKLWTTCLTTPADAKLHDRLAVLKNPNWQDLDRVAIFLGEQNIASRDVCCYHSDLVSLYNGLNLLPPTRFVYVEELTVFFPDRREAIFETLRESPHRFIVTDIVSARLTPEQIEKLFSPAFQAALRKPTSKTRPYPWGYPIVFRAGNYLVHQVR